MTKEEFKKYRIKIIIANIIFFAVMLGLTLFALYNKNANRILFSDTFLPQDVQQELNIYLDRHRSHDGFLFTYIWGFCVLFLLPFDINYFEEKNKLFGQAKIKDKDKKFRKIAIYLFSITTVLNILFFVFALEENFVGKYGFSLSTETVAYSFLGIIGNITLLLSAIFL